MGGEWGGAVLMAFEYAPPERRGFYACFPQIGFAARPVPQHRRDHAAVLRCCRTRRSWPGAGAAPSWSASCCCGSGCSCACRLFETPEFSRIRGSYHVTKLPLGEVAREYGGNVRAGLAGPHGRGRRVHRLYAVYVLVSHRHRPPAAHAVLSSVTVAALVLMFTMPLASAWSDRVGRRRLFAIATLVNGVAAFPAVVDAAIRRP